MQIIDGEIITNEMTKNARGGSELMAYRLKESLPSDLLNGVQLILSRVRDLDNTKHRILWCHDLAQDPEAAHLANEGWKKFHKIVFVSYWQRQQFMDRFGIPFSKTVVILNAIQPFTSSDTSETYATAENVDAALKKFNTTNFIYHTTPHRGLELLVPVFEKLSEQFKDIHLDVYSSFSVYGWAERDKPYEALFDRIKNHPQMTYHGARDNIIIRQKLLLADVYAYPCIWPETSCLSLMEAMAAGLVCIHSNLAALPETAANCTTMYNFDEDHNKHATLLYHIISNYLSNINIAEAYQKKAEMASDYANIFYDWNSRVFQWKALLESVKNEPVSFDVPSSDLFVYEVK